MKTSNGMNKSITVSIILALGVIGGFWIYYSPQATPTPPTQNNSDISTPQKWESKTDEQSAVTVTVTPIGMSPDSKEWKFDVTMETHSVELDQDMVNVAMLVDDSGKEYRPLRWEGAPPGGHHREGVLSFNSVQPMPKSVEMKIKDIAGIPERVFTWDF